ncbi:MAG TPA: type II toxin-antitoxin system RelE/ParE family toxin [Gammaproteobacteria bacterium]|nr:type II toxin-antitoxin system RelE/ParE family toxin [Gammaproteobacteria bacterium]
MRYKLLIKKQAKKTLQSLARPDRNRIAEKITLLGENPDNPALDIKPLQGEPYYRLRVGQWRIIFDRDDLLKIIAIEKIKPRGGAYK